MDALGPLHPALVHTPIALLLFSLIFELVGRATDLAWWRKAAMAMLVIGALGAWAAVFSGNAAEEVAEEQGVPHELIEAHESGGQLTAWVATAAVAARALAGRAGAARAAVAGLALALHVLAAAAVGMTGYRGGVLVHEHGAGVRQNGRPIPHPGRAADGARAGEARDGDGAAHGEATGAGH